MNAITPSFSLYLDAVRFLAALIVFLGHAAGQNWTGGFLWQTGLYGDTCVIVFFVLSGFVIAYVVDIKENRWQTYASSRVARLWSVTIPALILTLVIDTIGVQVAPALYIGQEWYRGDQLILRYIATFFMLHEIWGANLTPGINIPFWSLSYEAFYYLLFGILLFTTGRTRWLLGLVVAVIMGPMILVLLPTWLFGVLAYRWCKAGHLGKEVSIVLFFAGLLGLMFSPTIRAQLPATPEFLGPKLLQRYADAVAFLANLMGAHGMLRASGATAPSLRRLASIVAAATFPLYLFHRPLLQLFSYAGPEDPSSWQRRVLVIVGTLLVVFVTTPLCDQFKRFLQRLTMRWFTPPAAPDPRT